MNQQHSPVPWSLDDDMTIVDQNWHGVCELGTYGEIKPWLPFKNHLANAEFIVRACNNHDRLLAALIELSEWHRNEYQSNSEIDARVAAAIAAATTPPLK
jgi:hypothetical protein